MTLSALLPSRPDLVRFTLVLLVIFLIFWVALTGRNAAADPPLWTDVDEADIALRGERRIVPDSYRTLSLNVDALPLFWLRPYGIQRGGQERRGRNLLTVARWQYGPAWFCGIAGYGAELAANTRKSRAT